MRPSTGNNCVQDEGILKQSRREIRCWCLTFTVSGNGRALTEDVELEDGLGLAHYVLGAAYDQPPVVVRREVGQGEGEAALCIRDLDVETSKRPRIPKNQVSWQEAQRSQKSKLDQSKFFRNSACVARVVNIASFFHSISFFSLSHAATICNVCIQR